MRRMDNQDSLLGHSLMSWQVRALLILLVGLSFGLRVYDLGGKGLWSDEGLTLRRAEQPLGILIQNVNLIPVDPDYQDASEPEMVVETPDLHPPLYFLLMHVWIQLAGKSEFALRFLSVVAATLAVPLLYAVARSLFGRETGLWAALMGAISPFYLWYAQEARMYTWLIVFSLASIYSFLPLLRDRPRRRDYAAYIAVTLALLYTHYAGFLLLAFELAVYALTRLQAGRRRIPAILAALVLAVLPLVPFMWRLLQMQPFSFTYRPLTVILREAWGSFSLGPTRSAVQPWWRLIPFLVLFAIGSLMFGIRRRRRAWVVGFGYLAAPILTQYALSLLKPNYMNPRHLMVVAPAWELLLAQGLTTLRRRFKPGLLVILGLVLFLRLDASYDILTSHHFWKDDIRGAVRYIEDRARPGDAIVLHHPVIRLTFDYYYDGPYPETAIPRYNNNQDTEKARAAFADWARRYGRIWFVYGPPPTYFPHDFLPNWAEENLFKVCQQEFEAWWTYVGVAAYERSAPTLDALPDGVRPLGETWGELGLVGLQAQNTTAGDNAWLDLYWHRDGELPDEPLKLKAQLQDEAGIVWYERTDEVLPFYAPATWPSNQLVHVGYRLPLPEDLPPITYTVGLEPVGLGDLRTVGQVKIERPTAPNASARSMARFQDGIVLLEGSLDSDRFRAGYPLTGSLIWRADSTPSADYQLRVRLFDPQEGQVTVNQIPPSAAGFPTSNWLPGDRVAGRLQLPVPADLKSGSYRVEIGLVDPEGDRVLPVWHWYGRRDWLTLGTVQVEVWPLVTEVPAQIGHRLEGIELADRVHLRGYDLEREDDTLKITLYWQARDSLTENYHVFIHVGEADQPPLAEAGGLPVDWTRPTTSWRQGEVIADEHTVSLSGVPPGRYDLLVGFYEPQTGQRPRTVVEGSVVPGGYVQLQEVDVE